MEDQMLRTTPREMRGRDVTLFPEALRAERERGCPRHYAVRVTRSRVCFTFDAFFVPPDIEVALDRLYRDYLAWWIAKGNPARQRVPSYGFVVFPPHDFVMVTVLREHAEWWVGLFRAVLPRSYQPVAARARGEGVGGATAAGHRGGQRLALIPPRRTSGGGA